MAKRGRYINTEPTADNLRALWERLHSLDDQVTAHDATIKAHDTTLTDLQTTTDENTRAARTAIIGAGRVVPPLKIPGIIRQSAGGGGGGGGGGGSSTPFCSTQPLSTALPGWLYTALQAAGQTDNCWSAAMESSIEATFNANDFTIVTGLACSVRGRICHQGNHGLWTTCGGRQDAQYVADLVVDVVVTNPDGSVSWGWVPR